MLYLRRYLYHRYIFSKIFSKSLGYFLVEKFFRKFFLLQSYWQKQFGNQWLFTLFLPIFPVWRAISLDLLVALVYFLCIIFPKGLGYRLTRKSFRNFFRCIGISKNKLEIIELFAIFFQIVKIETLCLRQYWWADLFFHTMFWNNPGYLMPKKFSEIFFAAELSAKIIWKSIFFTDFVLL